MVSTPLKNISQIGRFSQVGMNIKNIWNHHLDVDIYIYMIISGPALVDWATTVFSETMPISHTWWILHQLHEATNKWSQKTHTYIFIDSEQIHTCGFVKTISQKILLTKMYLPHISRTSHPSTTNKQTNLLGVVNNFQVHKLWENGCLLFPSFMQFDCTTEESYVVTSSLLQL